MSEKFNAGDVVECVDSYNSNFLVKGQFYTIVDISVSQLKVKDTHGVTPDFYWSPRRFKKVKNMEDKTNTVTLNDVTYKVEYIEGKGECLVPVKPEYKKGQVYKYKPTGNIWLVLTPDKMVMIDGINVGAQLPTSVLGDVQVYEFLANTITEAVQKGLIK